MRSFGSVALRPPDGQRLSLCVGPLRSARSATASMLGDAAGEALPAGAVPNMLSFRHFGVYMSYLCVGFIYGSAQAIVYPVIVILHGEPNNVQQAVQSSFTLWWSFKVFYGILSDNVPIFGLRRKPYLLLGWLIAVGCSTALALTAQLSGTTQICQDDARQKVPCNGSQAYGPFEICDLSVNSLIIFMIANNFGYVMADVAMDSLVIEYAQKEPPEERGAIQGWCYTTRALGFVVSYAITGFGLNGPAYGGSFSAELPLADFLWILVGLQAVGLPWWLALHEERVDPSTLGASVSARKAVELMQNKTFSKLMIFNVIMNMSQLVTVNARNTVLAIWVKMTPLVNSLDSVLQQFIMMLTLAAAAKWFKSYNWRSLLVFGTLFYIAIMFLFWLVVFDVVRNPWLVIFIDGDQTFAQNIGYLVVMWAVVEMAPPGIEGTTLALTTTVGNAGQSLGSYVVMAFNAMFALNREDIVGDSMYTRYQYMFNALACMAMQCVFILFIAWMPTQNLDARQKYLGGGKSNAWGVVAFAFVVVALTWGIGSTLAALACPCSRILGGDGCPDGCASG